MDSHLAVALVGTGFMGRAHANAWQQVTRFADPPLSPVRHTVVGRDQARTADFARRWDFAHAATDLAAVLTDGEIDLVDITTPNDSHRELALTALAAGRYVACEKPLAATLSDARAMAAAAADAPGRTSVWFSYRRVPAIALAHLLVAAGRLGPIRHVRAVYAQQWGQGAAAAWRFDGARAGSGALGDIAAHIVDTVQFVTGEQVVEVAGGVEVTFDASHTVDDAVAFVGRLSGGATATFEATRYATGYHNHHGFEIHGEHGALRFWFDEMGRLGVYDTRAEALTRGWTTVEVSDGEAGHPWVGMWWPAGHPIGYEHTFAHQAYDLLQLHSGLRPVVPVPDFADALQVQTVLETALLAARRGSRVLVEEVANS
jgi:predicted dehydrogenase